MHRATKLAVLLLSCLAATPTVAGTSFSLLPATMTPLYAGSVDWGDFDGDDDLDVLITGRLGAAGAVRLYRNNGGGTFALVTSGLTCGVGSSAEWGDYDNDGDLDIIMMGQDAGTLYRNDAGSFATSFPTEWATAGDVAWGDFTNDGDLDLAFTGHGPGGAWRTALLDNAGGGSFPILPAGLQSLFTSSLAWGDFDNDRDLDLVVAGETVPGAATGIVYRNTPSGFANIGATLANVTESSVAWGDYDVDGDLDLAMSGYAYTLPHETAIIYRNDAGTLTPIVSGMTGVYAGSLAWGDYDNDGLLDIVSTGSSAPQVPACQLMRNLGNGSFASQGAVTAPVFASSIQWGDYDNDGDLDLLMNGADGVNAFSRVYRNDSPAFANQRPSAPNGLAAVASSNTQTTFSWNAATDDNTHAAGLTYNLRVGTTPGGNQVMSAMASAGGYRRVPRLGNTNHNLSWTLTLPAGTYYWSVQAIDASFAGSEFATEQIHVATTGVSDDPLSATIELAARPNPFADLTTIEFGLSREGRVSLRIHDIGGRLVRTLVEPSIWPAGRHPMTWDGLADDGRPAPAGVYLASVDVDGVRNLQRLVRLR
jgi:FG-GAP-like repeat/FlgD Ig-like domain